MAKQSGEPLTDEQKKIIKRVGIGCETYKVERFRSVLKRNGYETEVGKGVTSDTSMLYTECELGKLNELNRILMGLQREFANRN